jgi:Tol biopolymer transport system component
MMMLFSSVATCRTSEEQDLAKFHDADILFMKKEWAQAAEAYRRIAAQEPKSGRAWYRLGLSLHQLADYQKATPAMENAIRFKYVGQGVFYNLAAAYAQQGNLRKAIECLKKAVALGFDQPEQLRQDDSFASLREAPQFGSILNEARQRSFSSKANPVWSPNGMQIMFEQTQPDGRTELVIVDVHGHRVRTLASDDEYMGMASWSHDGSKIVFSAGASFDHPGIRDIFVMNCDGSAKQRLTSSVGSNHFPQFSPDDRKIVFNSDRDGHREIYLMNADGSNQTRLTDTVAHSDYPGWSTEGKKIVFESSRDGGWETFVMNADGGKQIRISPEAADTSAPRFSPDEKRIVFHSARTGNFDIFVMDADGAHRTRLTSNPASDVQPSWSADGKRIAFVSDRSGRKQVYTMNAHGKHLRCVTCGAEL